MRALQKADQCRGPIAPWFRAVVRTSALNLHRYDKQAVEYKDWLHGADLSRPEPDYVPMLESALKQLTDRERDCILGKYIRQDSRNQLAKKHGCTGRTISSDISCGIKKLKKLLEDV